MTQPLNAQAWNYWFALNQGGPNVCDVSVSNNVEVDSSFYIMGNLCLSNNAKIVEDLSSPRIPIIVAVQGKFGYSNGTSIGRSSTNTVSEAHINGGCGGTSLTSTHTCKAYPSSGYDSIYATTFDTAGSLVTPPVIDGVLVSARKPGAEEPLCGWRRSRAGMGQRIRSLQHPAGHPGHLPERERDDRIRSDPAQDYSCSTSNGSISWSALTKTLTVRGVMYIDGSAAVTNGAVNEYNGMATLYLSGSLSVNGMMCGKRNANLSDCDFTGWNPNTEMFIIGAHGVDASGNSVFLNNSAKWEGGIYGIGVDYLSNNAVVEARRSAARSSSRTTSSSSPFRRSRWFPSGRPATRTSTRSRTRRRATPADRGTGPPTRSIRP